MSEYLICIVFRIEKIISVVYFEYTYVIVKFNAVITNAFNAHVIVNECYLHWENIFEIHDYVQRKVCLPHFDYMHFGLFCDIVSIFMYLNTMILLITYIYCLM